MVSPAWAGSCRCKATQDASSHTPAIAGPAQRLKQAGKLPKVVVACMRKLLTIMD